MKEVWIGLFHIIPNEGNNLLSNNAIGAFVNALALAENPNEFIKLTNQSFNALNFTMNEYEDIELFEHRKISTSINIELLKLSKSISSKNPIVFDVFQSYGEEE